VYNVVLTQLPTHNDPPNDLMLGKGQVTPENRPLIVRVDFFCRLVRGVT
jgi:hypothetical protein